MRNYAHKILYVIGLTLLTVILTYAPIESEHTATTVHTEGFTPVSQNTNSLLITNFLQASEQESKSEKPSNGEQPNKDKKVPNIGGPDDSPKQPVVDGYKQTSNFYMVSSSQLNVRVQPSSDAKIVKTLKKGDTVTSIGLSNGWLQLEGGGFVNAKYVEDARETKVNRPLASRSLERPRVIATSVEDPQLTYDVSQPSNLTEDQLNLMLEGTELRGLGHAFKRIEDEFGVNALTGVGIAKLESGNGKSPLARNKNNLFGLNAIDGDAYNKAYSFSSKEECIVAFGGIMKRVYLDKGQKTLTQINRKYAPRNDQWAGRVKGIMKADYGKINIQ